jgi:hypothetical protein
MQMLYRVRCLFSISCQVLTQDSPGTLVAGDWALRQVLQADVVAAVEAPAEAVVGILVEVARQVAWDPMAVLEGRPTMNKALVQVQNL